MRIVLSVLWFFLPAGVGNLTPIIASKIPFLKRFSYPLDFYLKFNKKRLFGDHKTIRGLISGTIAGIITAYLQVLLYNQFSFFREVSLINYNSYNPFILGFLGSFGALAGDAIKSLFKRQLGIAEGKPWFLADQIDYILGGIFFTSFYVKLGFSTYIILIVVWFFLHPLSTFIGWMLRLKDDPI